MSVINDAEYKVWLTSDLHFGHQKEFLYGPRGYNSNVQMMEDVIKRWNDKVAPEDHVYVMGDLIVGENEPYAFYMLQRLNGHLHVVLGNHDSDRRADLYKKCSNIDEVALAMRFRYKKFHCYLSHYPTLTSNYDDEEPLYTRVINFCGHTHTKDPFHDWGKGTIYHVELDAHNNEPVLIDDAIEQMKQKIRESKICISSETVL